MQALVAEDLLEAITRGHSIKQMDIEDTRLNCPWGRFSENKACPTTTPRHIHGESWITRYPLPTLDL